MHVDRAGPIRLAKQAHDPLRLAQCVSPDDVRAFRKQAGRLQQLVHLRARVGVAEHGQAERRLGDEYVARDDLERQAGRIGCTLVVAGDDDPRAAGRDGDLRRAEHVAGGVKGGGNAAKVDGRAEVGGLLVPAKPSPVAHGHDGQRLACRQHRAVAGPGVVGVAVGDQGTFHRPHRVDVHIGAGQ